MGLSIKLKQTTTIFLSDHYILSRECRVIVDKVYANYHGRPMLLKSVSCDRAFDYGDPHFGLICFKLKPSGFSILSCEKGLGLRPRPFSQLIM